MRLLENMILSGHCRSKHMCICIYIYEFLTIMKLACLLHQVIVGCSYLPYFWLLILITRQIDTSTQSQINHSSRVQGKEFERSPPSSSLLVDLSWVDGTPEEPRELHPFWSVSTDRNSPWERSLCNATSTQKRPEKNH